MAVLVITIRTTHFAQGGNGTPLTIDPLIVTIYGKDSPYCGFNDNWTANPNQRYSNSSVGWYAINGCQVLSNASSISTPPNTSSNNNSNNLGETAQIVIGVVIPVVSIFVGVFGVHYARKQYKKKQSGHNGHNNHVDPNEHSTSGSVRLRTWIDTQRRRGPPESNTDSTAVQTGPDEEQPADRGIPAPDSNWDIGQGPNIENPK